MKCMSKPDLHLAVCYKSLKAIISYKVRQLKLTFYRSRQTLKILHIPEIWNFFYRMFSCQSDNLVKSAAHALSGVRMLFPVSASLLRCALILLFFDSDVLFQEIQSLNRQANFCRFRTCNHNKLPSIQEKITESGPVVMGPSLKC